MTVAELPFRVRDVSKQYQTGRDSFVVVELVDSGSPHRRSSFRVSAVPMQYTRRAAAFFADRLNIEYLARRGDPALPYAERYAEAVENYSLMS